MTSVPEAGVVFESLGSDSQVTTPLYLRMYLYWKAVLAGRATVTEETDQLNYTWKGRVNVLLQVG